MVWPLPEINASADFFKTENIKGSIFNNYDIGGYLIFNLFPNQKLFVDNRPEYILLIFLKKLIFQPKKMNPIG